VQLVVLAAGHGRRFGGLKQLAPVGPGGEAIMDYTAQDALEAGFETVVLVVREEVREELLDHTARYWPPELEVTPVLQGPVAGTAQAVASAAPVVSGPFGVANADDLYGPAALALLAGELAELSRLDRATHSIVGYRLADTILTDAPVTRGVCETSPEGELVRVAELEVRRESGGFRARPIGSAADWSADPGEALTGDEVVSMNLWGLAPSIFGHLEAALDAFDPETAPHPPGKPAELLLPVVVGDLVGRRAARVRVRRAEGRCIGITHPDDLPIVREMVATERGEEAGR
jgi:hypothetical protein